MSKAGVVKFFSAKTNFGFISPNECGNGFYVHGIMVIGQALMEGDEVSFDVGYDDRSGKLRWCCKMVVATGKGGGSAAAAVLTTENHCDA